MKIASPSQGRPHLNPDQSSTQDSKNARNSIPLKDDHPKLEDDNISTTLLTLGDFVETFVIPPYSTRHWLHQWSSWSTQLHFRLICHLYSLRWRDEPFNNTRPTLWRSTTRLKGYYCSFSTSTSDPKVLNIPCMHDYLMYKRLSTSHRDYLNKISCTCEPSTFLQASQSFEWVQAMNEELVALEFNQT